jgi:hypothetical protein
MKINTKIVALRNLTLDAHPAYRRLIFLPETKRRRIWDEVEP